MKRVFVLAVVVCSVTACKKNIQLHNSSIVGKWKLSEYLADPGDGSGTWQPADHHIRVILNLVQTEH